MYRIEASFLAEFEKLAKRKITPTTPLGISELNELFDRYESGKKVGKHITPTRFDDWYAHHHDLQNPGHATEPMWWRRALKRGFFGISGVAPGTKLPKYLQRAGERVYQGGVSPERTRAVLDRRRQEAMEKKRLKKNPTIWSKYKYPIVLGGAGLVGYKILNSLNEARRQREEY